MINPKQFALDLIRRNPNISSNPNAQGMINVIQSGDEEQGKRFAENLCATYGVSKEQALEDARRFFHI